MTKAEQDELVAAAVANTIALRDATSLRQARKLDRDQAIWDLYHSAGLTHVQIVERIQAELTDQGHDVLDVIRLAPARETVRTICGTHARPKRRPGS